MKVKARILNLVRDENWSLLPELLKNHGKRKDKTHSGLEEALGEMSHTNQEFLWNSVVNLFLQNYIKKYLDKEDQAVSTTDTNDEEEQKDFDVLKSLLVLADIHVNVLLAEKKDVPEPSEKMVTFVVLIGGLLNEFADLIHKTALSVCETWVSNGFDKAEEIRPQTVFALLRISLSPDGKKADVKRLWSLCKCSPDLLSKMTLNDDESAKSTRDLIISSATSSEFLSCEEGLKFLSAAFSLSHMVAVLHETVKRSLPCASKLNSEKYAQVYFRAWKNSQGDMKRKLEMECLQDLMYLAVHANPEANRLSSNLTSLLQHIHMHKKHLQTASVIYSLYEPFLWQSLKVANGYVRTNAATLLCDLFPCTDLSLTHEEKDELMEKQYQAFLSLLLDPCLQVRIATIKGVFTILKNFWLLVPARIIQKVFQIFLTKLVVDASSAEVRKLVVQGMTQLLDCPDAGPYMTDVLPHVSGSFDDVNTSVRIAFMKLLLKVKATRFIKYWKLIPLEHLLNRLAYDAIAVRVLITNLIYSSFLSAHLEEQELLNRCISLLEMNRDGARRFYQEASKKLDIDSLARFMIFIWKVLQSYVQMTVNTLSSQTVEDTSPRSQEASQGHSTKKAKKAALRQARNKENKAPQLGESADDSPKSSNSSKDENGDSSEMPLDNPIIVGGLLDILAILWTINSHRLGLPENLKYIEALRTRISRTFPTVWSFFKENDDIGKTLLYLSSFLPKSHVPNMVGLCLSRLKSIEDKEELDERFLTYVNALCNWNRLDDIVELLSEWLDDTFTSVEGSKNLQPPVNNKKTVRVCFEEKKNPKPFSALRILSHILEHPLNKLNLLKTNRKLLVHFCSQMGRVQKFLDMRLRSEVIPLSSVCSDRFLWDCWYDYLCVVLLLNQAPQPEILHPGTETQRSTRRNAGGVNNGLPDEDIESHDSLALYKEFFSSFAKSISEEQVDSLAVDWSFYFSCASQLLKAGSDAIAIGIVDESYANQFLDFSKQILRKAPLDVNMWCFALQGISRIHYHYRVYSEEETSASHPLILSREAFSSIVPLLKYKRDDLHDVDELMCDKLSHNIESTILNLNHDSDDTAKCVSKQLVVQTLESVYHVMESDPDFATNFTRIKDLNGEPLVLMSVIHKNTRLCQAFIHALKTAIGNEVQANSLLEACCLLLSVLNNDAGRMSRHGLKEAARSTLDFIEKMEHPGETSAEHDDADTNFNTMKEMLKNLISS